MVSIKAISTRPTAEIQTMMFSHSSNNLKVQLLGMEPEILGVRVRVTVGLVCQDTYCQEHMII